MTDNMAAIYKTVKKVNHFRDEMRKLSDAELKDKTRQFKERIQAGESLDQLLPEAFAVIREADLRVLQMFPYDDQIFGGIVIHQGDIADMKTGEGKSLTATMPLYLNALTGKGAILVTVNTYLANRDGHKLGQVFEFMNLTVAIGVPLPGMSDFTPAEKRQIYQADIIYTTADKLGFDYLLENISSNREDRYLRPYNFVVIDEADAILLDMASMPLIISGAPRVQSNLYPLADKFTGILRKDIEYDFEPSSGAVSLSAAGIQAAQRFYQIDNLYEREHFRLNRHINLSIRAKELFQPLRDYLVVDNKVMLLSADTGRLLEGNKLQGGLHQAIEAKEEVPITKENRAMASITYQNLFYMFATLSGMTGTAKGSEEELLKTYRTKIIEVPTYRPIIRQDLDDQVFKTMAEKEQQIIAKIKAIHATGQPVLLTTSSVKNSAKFSHYLLNEGISHNLLNALSEAKEAEMIAEAGQRGAVTVATLMAGRGTDIKLGEGVKELGGLYIIGTEKMPSQRIDWQIRGRAGRMGDPGSSIFYTSLEDDVFVRYGTVAPEKIVKSSFSNRQMHMLLKRAQRVSEDNARGARDLALQFDIAMSKQRDMVYQERDQIIARKRPITTENMMAIASDVFDEFLSHPQESMKDRLLRFVYDTLSFHLPEDFETLDFDSQQQLKLFLMQLFTTKMAEKKQDMAAADVYEKFQSLVFLKAIDEAWVEQVDYLEQLKTVVLERTVAQHKIEYEYRREAFLAYQEMRKQVYLEIIRLFCLSEIETKWDGSMVVQFA